MVWCCRWLSGGSILSSSTSHRRCVQWVFERTSRHARGCTLANTKKHAHFNYIFRDALAEVYHERWTVRIGPVPWLASSLDHNYSYLYLCGQLYQFLYLADINNTTKLFQRVMEYGETIQNLAGAFERIRHIMIRRLHGSVEKKAKGIFKICYEFQIWGTTMVVWNYVFMDFTLFCC